MWGFDPWTFGSKAPSLTSRATTPAWSSLPKLRVVLLPLFPYMFSPLFLLSFLLYILCIQNRLCDRYETLHDVRV